MKKLFLSMAALAMILFVGCQKEEGVKPVEQKLTAASLEKEFGVEFSATNDSEFATISVTLEELRDILQAMKQSDGKVESKGVGNVPDGYYVGPVSLRHGPDGWVYVLSPGTLDIGGRAVSVDLRYTPTFGPKPFTMVIRNPINSDILFQTSGTAPKYLVRGKYVFHYTVPVSYTFAVSGTTPSYLKVSFVSRVQWIENYLPSYTFAWYDLGVKNVSTPN